ncbi:Disease resistance RPP13-like protein [Actinidia chinensis var. chinensis]|uniref:Disease resistance RPP13-like protein n=1 Tax=Actinidia chinensis var. chinensis TaxID=1590841 RepID=A0A2R6R2C9_ACTCC|nr:Disease resistance RPP13-like protein [Actinidia chinensis var. chinensis]
MSIREATSPPPSSSSHDTHNPSVQYASPSETKFSIRSSEAQIVKSKQTISKSKPLKHHHHDDASSSTTIINKNEDNNNRSHALCKSIRQDLFFMKEKIAEGKKCVEMDDQVKKAHVKFEELQAKGNPEGELDELKKDIKKLKSKIPSQSRTYSADSNTHRNSWPDINKSNDEMMYMMEPKVEDTMDPAHLSKVFFDLPRHVRHCLLCFLLFPEKAVIRRRVMIYLWIADSDLERMDEYIANKILDKLTKSGLIKPVYQKFRLEPDSCTMSLSVRSTLSEIAEREGCYKYDQHLINVGEAIIDSELYEEKVYLTTLYLGRWQSSTTHHIEVANTNMLRWSNNLEKLRFLSLQGISLISELPSFISKLTHLEILDLRACHNLEEIPHAIGSLMWLTHLDMSECYFLEYIPKSLGNLTRLQVLKGFFIGDSKEKKLSCTLDDLSRLQDLRKLNIYTSAEDFPTEKHLNALQKFGALRKLTISWGGCSLLGENDTNPLGKSPLALPFTLEKLELQCFRWKSPPSWLRLADMKQLKNLYIIGGKLCDLGHFHEVIGKDGWTVKILRLKYLNELKEDWTRLRILFPKLVFLHKVKCPKLTGFEFDEDGVWINTEAIDQAHLEELKDQFAVYAAAEQRNHKCDENGVWIYTTAIDRAHLEE